MNQQLHFALQYLAMAGKSFLDPKSDDSHTNVGYKAQSKSFETWELNDNGLKLLFDLSNFQLKWSTGALFELDGKKHGQVLQWLQVSAEKGGLDRPYVFDLHYELPFSWDSDFSFELSNPTQLNELAQLRTLANNVLTVFLKEERLQSDIRIWPHHFDTGAFVILNDGSGTSVGLGMAIPDSLLNDHYFYLSGYNGHDGIDTSDFSTLAHGKWVNNGFKGAVLPTTGITEKDSLKFLQEAFAKYN